MKITPRTQNSGYVAKISAHITKKVADKLTSMFASDRENYESLWRDLKTFVEYGSMRDAKFFERVRGAVLFERCSGGFVTLDEYLGNEGEQSGEDKKERKIYYSTDKTAQAQYISMLSNAGIEVLLLDRMIDTQFINTVEAANEGVKFQRVDSEIADVLRDDGECSEIPEVRDVLAKIVPEGVKIEFDRFKDTDTPAILHVPEDSRRFEDMMKMYNMAGGESPMKAPGSEPTLTVNTASPLIAHLAEKCSSDAELAEKIARQIYELSLLSQRKLNSDELCSLLKNSYDILGLL